MLMFEGCLYFVAGDNNTDTLMKMDGVEIIHDYTSIFMAYILSGYVYRKHVNDYR